MKRPVWTSMILTVTISKTMKMMLLCESSEQSVCKVR